MVGLYYHHCCAVSFTFVYCVETAKDTAIGLVAVEYE